MCWGHYQKFLDNGTINDVSPVLPRACAHCNVVFTPLAIKWKQRFCSKKCIDNYAAQQRRGPVPERPCEWCGAVITSDRRTDARFCTDTCQSDSSNARISERLRATKAEQAKICPTCLAPLDLTKNKNAMFCSRDCKLTERNVQKYGISYQDKLAMLAEQGGVCAICKTDDWGAGKGPAIDHCHRTGAVRALLCGNCNQGLGRFKDDIDLLRAAITYIEVYQ